MNITLRQLRAFLTVGELASFTRAGKELGLAQSAVSMLVSELERELDLRLLDRTTRRVEATEAGRAFAAQASRVLAELEAGIRAARDLAERRSGRLTVFAPPLLATTLLPHAIAIYRARYPGISITLLDGGTQELVARVRSGEADFAIGTVAAGQENLAVHPIAHDRLVLFCPAGHALARQRSVAWTALRNEPLIALTPQSGLRHLVEMAAGQAGILLNPVYEVAQIASALAMVAAGLGIAVLPSVAGAASPARLARRRLIRPDIVRDIQIVHRAGRSLSPASESFIAVLRAELARMSRRDVLMTQPSAARPIQGWLPPPAPSPVN